MLAGAGFGRIIAGRAVVAKNSNINLFGKQSNVSQTIKTATETRLDLNAVQEFCQTAGGMISGGIVSADEKGQLAQLLAQIEGLTKTAPEDTPAIRSGLHKFIDFARKVASKTASAALVAAATAALAALG